MPPANNFNDLDSLIRQIAITAWLWQVSILCAGILAALLIRDALHALLRTFKRKPTTRITHITPPTSHPEAAETLATLARSRRQGG